MKTRIVWIMAVLLLVIVTPLQAQTKQKGYTKTKGRLGTNGTVIPGMRLANVSVILQDDNSTVSDAKGNFSLSVSSNRFYLKKVQKQGYAISDPDALSKQYACSSNDLVLVLETPSEQLEDKLNAELKIRHALQQQLERQKNEIAELKEQNKITQEEYLQRLQKLFADQEKDDKLISDMAERYSKMDFDVIDEFNRRISDAILNGRLTEADSLLSTKGDINQRIIAFRQHQEANTQAEQEIKIKQKNLEKSKALAQKELEDLAQDCYSKFEIFKMQHQLDSATYYIEKRAGLDSLNTIWLDETGDFFYNIIGDYEKAMKYFSQVLNIRKITLPKNDLSIAKIYINIGAVYSEQGLYEKALENCMKALEILEIETEDISKNYFDIALNYDNIAVIYINQGLYDKALDYQLKAIEIRKTTLSENDLYASGSYNNVAVIYADLEEFDKALEYHIKALEIQKAILPENHPKIAHSYNNIAYIYGLQGLYDQSVEYFYKALDVQKASISENHPDIAYSYNNIGYILFAQKLYESALENYQKALEIFKKTLPENHPNIATMYNNIAAIYAAKEIYNQALEYYLKALEMLKSTLPENHPNIVSTYNSIAKIYSDQELHNQALEYYLKALKVQISNYGEGHKTVVQSYENIGHVYEKLGNIQKAEEYKQKAENVKVELEKQ